MVQPYVAQFSSIADLNWNFLGPVVMIVLKIGSQYLYKRESKTQKRRSLG
jgi:hypothetical protein